jgi:rhodanese-related sulfurtransferase
LLSRDRPIVLVADPGTEEESALRLGRIGFDSVIGYLDGGLRAVDAVRPELITTTERVTPELAAERLAGADPPLLVDVRTAGERAQKSLPDSVHIPLNHLEERAVELPDAQPLIVYCAGGYRSSIAASLLQRLGFTRVSEIAGGLAACDGAGVRFGAAG